MNSYSKILALAAVAMFVGQAHSQAVAVSMSSGYSLSESDGIDVTARTGGFTNSAAYNDIEGLIATATALSENTATAENDLGFAGSFTGVGSRAIEAPDSSETAAGGMLSTDAQSIGAGNANAEAEGEATGSAFDEPFGDDPVSFSGFRGTSGSFSGPRAGGAVADSFSETTGDSLSSLREAFANGRGDSSAFACYGEDCPFFGGRRLFY